jgi:hypothetical protein
MYASMPIPVIEVSDSEDDKSNKMMVDLTTQSTKEIIDLTQDDSDKENVPLVPANPISVKYIETHLYLVSTS